MKNKLVYFTLILFSYVLAYMYTYSDAGNEYPFYFLLLFSTSILVLAGAASYFLKVLADDFKAHKPDKEELRNRIILFAMWIMAVLSVKQIGWIATGVPSSIVIFVSILPVFWLFKVRNPATTLISFTFLIYTAVLTAGQMRAATVFAELFYLWLAASVIMYLTENN